MSCQFILIIPFPLVFLISLFIWRMRRVYALVLLCCKRIDCSYEVIVSLLLVVSGRSTKHSVGELRS